MAIVQQQRSVRAQQLSAFVFGKAAGREKSGREGKLGIFRYKERECACDAEDDI